MLSINAYIIVVLFVLGFSGIMFSRSDRDIVGFGLCMIIIAFIIFFGSFGCHEGFHDIIADNTNSSEMFKVNYVQYHPFMKDTIESVIVPPGQARILENVKVISQKRMNINEL